MKLFSSRIIRPMGRIHKDPDTLDPLRRALWDVISEKKLSMQDLSAAAGKNNSYVSKYLWQHNPTVLALEEGIKIAQAAGIDPAVILGDRYNSLTSPAKGSALNAGEGTKQPRGSDENMDVIYSVAVEALSKLSPSDMVNALSEASEKAKQRRDKMGPTKRETAL